MNILRIPPNQIKNKYTSGNEYMSEQTQQEYKGPYYEFNGKVYIGKEYSVNSPTLIKLDSTNSNNLLSKAGSYIYGVISNNVVKSKKIYSHIYTDQKERYYIYQINVKVIKEINEETYNNFINDPLYKVIKLKYPFNNTELDNGEKNIPGIKEFIRTAHIFDYFD